MNIAKLPELLAIIQNVRAAGYRARIMLWFSGESKQSVVLYSQAFIDATEYIPAQVSGTFAA